MNILLTTTGTIFYYYFIWNNLTRLTDGVTDGRTDITFSKKKYPVAAKAKQQNNVGIDPLLLPVVVAAAVLSVPPG